MPSRFQVERAVIASGLPSTARHIMLTLAVWSDNATAKIRPENSRSLSEIATATGHSESTVKVHLNLLEKGKWVTRKRPRAKAARQGAKTRYQLAVPPSEAAPEPDDLGLSAAHPEQGVGLSPPQGGPVVGPDLGLSPAQGGPVTGPKVYHSTDLNTQDCSGAPAPTAQTILAAFIDWDKSQGGTLTRRTTGQLARHISGLLAEGIDDSHIRRGLADWRARGQHPSTLDSFVSAAMNGRGRPASRRQAETDDMFGRALQRAQARETGQQGELT